MLCFLYLLLGVCLTNAIIVPPFNRGVVVKISEDLVQNLAEEVVFKAVHHLQGLTLSDSIEDGKLTINYWDMTFPHLLMAPKINLEKAKGQDKLVLEAQITGSIEADARWRVIRKDWYGTVSFTGGVEMEMEGFSVKSRVLLGEMSHSGYLGFQQDPDYCEFDAGALDLHFSGRAGWLINIIISLFKSEIRTVIEKYVCLTINEEIEKAAVKLNTAVFDRYDEFQMKGHLVQMNNRPWVVTGGDSCAVLGALGEITLPDPDIPRDTTDPFIDPTNHPEFFTTSSMTSSTGSSTSTILWTSERPKVRNRRAEEDLCSTLPGSESEVSIIVTEDMIFRISASLYHLNLINYKVVQGSGKSQVFEQFWGGKAVGTVRLATSNHALLKDYQIVIKITSTSLSDVSISEVGVVVTTPLRARVTLAKEGFEVRVEIHTTVTFLGRINLAQVDGVYRIVPGFTSGADVNRGRIEVGGLPGGTNLSEEILNEIEDQLNMMLGIGLPALVKKELENGFPLNIPSQHVMIEDADIHYRKGYIVITANDIQISL